MSTREDVRARFLKRLGQPFIGEDLFDAISDTVFFVKDVEGRYISINRTLVARTGRQNKDELIGLTAAEVFPGVLGQRIAEQDRAVIRDGRPLNDKLELHLYPGGEEGWCLTWKAPIMAADGTIIGLSGISRDLQSVAGHAAELPRVSRTLDHIQKNLHAPLRIAALAKGAGLSPYQLDLRIRGLFGLSLGQYLVRARIDLACNRLRHTDQPISLIALDCGYGDQAAFTRQFRKSVGLTPSQYQRRHRAPGGVA
jgi:AraC-like DNA-binding protein